MKHNRLKGFLTKHLKVSLFEKLKIPLVIVATDLISGKLIEYDSGNIIPPVMASSAIPLMFAPIKYKDRILVDGGVLAPLPIKTAKESTKNDNSC